MQSIPIVCSLQIHCMGPTEDILKDYSDIDAIEFKTGRRTKLISNGYDARYVSPGYLLFGRSGNLYAVEFDAKTFTGPIYFLGRMHQLDF